MPADEVGGQKPEGWADEKDRRDAIGGFAAIPSPVALRAPPFPAIHGLHGTWAPARRTSPTRGEVPSSLRRDARAYASARGRSSNASISLVSTGFKR